MLQPLFPQPSPWADPSTRARLLREADPEELLEGFAFYLSLEALSQGTVHNYLHLLRQFAAFLQGQGRDLRAPQRSDLLHFAHDLALRGHTPPHIQRASTALRRFGAFMQWCGLEPPLLDLPPKKVYERRQAPLEEEVLALLLREVHRYPGGGSPVLGLAYALMGGLGLRLKDIYPMTLADLELPRVRLPGGWSRIGSEFVPHLERYLEFRREWVKLPGYRRLLVLAGGLPPRSSSALHHHHYPYLAWLGLEPFPLRPVWLLGGRRMVEQYGLKEARRLLGRWVVG